MGSIMLMAPHGNGGQLVGFKVDIIDSYLCRLTQPKNKQNRDQNSGSWSWPRKGDIGGCLPVKWRQRNAETVVATIHNMNTRTEARKGMKTMTADHQIHVSCNCPLSTHQDPCFAFAHWQFARAVGLPARMVRYRRHEMDVSYNWRNYRFISRPHPSSFVGFIKNGPWRIRQERAKVARTIITQHRKIASSWVPATTSGPSCTTGEIPTQNKRRSLNTWTIDQQADKVKRVLQQVTTAIKCGRRGGTNRQRGAENVDRGGGENVRVHVDEHATSTDDTSVGMGATLTRTQGKLNTQILRAHSFGTNGNEKNKETTRTKTHHSNDEHVHQQPRGTKFTCINQGTSSGTNDTRKWRRVDHRAHSSSRTSLNIHGQLVWLPDCLIFLILVTPRNFYDYPLPTLDWSGR